MIAVEAPMASLSFISSLLTPRCQSHCVSCTPSDPVQLCILKQPRSRSIRAISKKNLGNSGVEDSSNGTAIPVEKAPKRTKQTPRRSKKVTSVKNDDLQEISAVEQGKSTEMAASSEDAKKAPRRSRKKAAASPAADTNGTPERVVKKGTRKKTDNSAEESDSEESGDDKRSILTKFHEYLQQIVDERVDMRFPDDLPPLVCCFGAARNCFVPSGRPANRFVHHDMHEAFKYMMWSPPKFVRAPGGSTSDVAAFLAMEGGRVALMGKLGRDMFGAFLVTRLNVKKVETQPVKIDSSRRTAVSHMKIIRRGGLKLSCTGPSAEDSFLSSEIDIDVLKETKLFYFNSSSLLDESMRSTTMLAIRICKGFGGRIFFDLNLPIPLWKSKDETMAVINEAWNSADFIEVTKQELEFLRGIKPSEKFDTKDNDPSKFVHYGSDVIRPLWHENLKVLFVTNGTTKVHYYTLKFNTFAYGSEDPPSLSPFTGEMSVAGDAFVAGLLLKLSTLPDRVFDIGYLEVAVRESITCAVHHQWGYCRRVGFPPKEGTPKIVNGRIKAITEKEYFTRDMGRRLDE